MNPDPDPETAELKLRQRDREMAEQRMAEEAPDEDETAQHARRADKASYLRQKLKERERSERESG
jgi:hypothetical protein